MCYLAASIMLESQRSAKAALISKLGLLKVYADCNELRTGSLVWPRCKPWWVLDESPFVSGIANLTCRISAITSCFALHSMLQNSPCRHLAFVENNLALHYV